MKRYLRLLIAFPSLWCWLIPTGLCAGEPQVKAEQVLQTMQSWDSSPYTSYPSEQPQITVLKITIPPNWHRHPIISVAYVLSGYFTLGKRTQDTSCSRWICFAYLRLRQQLRRPGQEAAGLSNLNVYCSDISGPQASRTNDTT